MGDLAVLALLCLAKTSAALDARPNCNPRHSQSDAHGTGQFRPFIAMTGSARVGTAITKVRPEDARPSLPRFCACAMR